MKILLSFFLLSMALAFNVCSQTVNTPTCFTDRTITGKVKGEEVKCMTDGEQFILISKDESTRYAVCNSDDFDLIMDSSYFVSGSTYEIKANERWPGTPFQLVSAKKKE